MRQKCRFFMPVSLGRMVSNVGTALRLPEFGLSERLGYSPPTAQRTIPQSQLSNYNFSSQPVNISQAYSSGGLGGGVLGASTSSAIPNSGVTGGGGSAQSPTNSQIPNIQQRRDQGLDLIDQDYQNFQ